MRYQITDKQPSENLPKVSAVEAAKKAATRMQMFQGTVMTGADRLG